MKKKQKQKQDSVMPTTLLYFNQPSSAGLLLPLPYPPPPLPLNRMVGHQKMAMLLLKFNLTVTRKGLC